MAERAEDNFDEVLHGGAGPRDGAVSVWNMLVIAAVLVNSTFETMLVPAIPLIREDLGLTAPQSAWVLTAFMLSAAVSLPIVGKLGDIFGSERVLAAVLAALTVGVLLPPAGNSFAALVAGQALQGLGVSLVPLGVALLTKQRGEGGDVRTAGIMMAGAVSTALGMVLAGVLLGFASYRILYWAAALPNCLIVGAALYLLARRGRGGDGVKQDEAIDWIGAMLFGGSLLSILLGLGAMEEGGWQSPLASGLLAAGLLLGALGIMWARSVRFPLIDVALLRTAAVNRVAMVQLLSGFGTFATFVAVPVLIQAPAASGGLGLDASVSGYALAPFGICCIVAPLFVAGLRRLLGAGAVLFSASLVAVAGPALLLVSGGSGIVVVGIAMGALGFGIGLLLTQSFDLVGSTVAPERVASIGSLVYVLKMVGAALGGQAAIAFIGPAPTATNFVQAFILAAAAMAGSALAAMTLLKQSKGDTINAGYA